MEESIQIRFLRKKRELQKMDEVGRVVLILAGGGELQGEAE